MAKKGSISITPGAYDIVKNTTPITVKGIITTSGDSWRGDHNTGKLVVKQNGKTIHSSTFTHGAPEDSTTTLFSKVITVEHYSTGESGTIVASYDYDSGWCEAEASKVLPKIPRQATISDADNFNDEENPQITYSNPAGDNVTSLQACISLTGDDADVPYRDIDIDGTTYTFELTDEERETLRVATTGSNSRDVKFYVKTVIDGTAFYSKLTRKFTIINGTPTLAPTVEDINETTLALTGNKSIIVRNQSNAEVHTGAQVYKSASIKNQKVICGNKSVNGEGGTIEAAGSGSFIFSVMDNRENTVTETVNVPFIEYVNLTCNLSANAPDAEGDMTFVVQGNCFGGSFGVADNVIKVLYRYKENNDEYGDEWIEATEVVVNDDNTYTAQVHLIGLNYQSKYTFQAMASDLLMEIASVERVVKTIPVFDWGENDFNFNVPVNFTAGFTNQILTEGSDFDEQKTPNIFTLKDISTAGYLNCPVSEGKGSLKIEECGEGCIHQILKIFDAVTPVVYERMFSNDIWGDWHEKGDSGWLTPTLSSDFTQYSASYPVRYRKIGKQVQIIGAVKPTATITGSGTSYTIFTLPEGFRPPQQLTFMCQGSLKNHWALNVNAGGNVCFTRYGHSGSYADAGTVAWLTFSATFFVD